MKTKIKPINMEIGSSKGDIYRALVDIYTEVENQVKGSNAKIDIHIKKLTDESKD